MTTPDPSASPDLAGFPVVAPPLPGPVAFDQRWSELTFLHWPVRRAHTRKAGRTWWVPNEHAPWPLHANVVELSDELVAAGAVRPAGERLGALYSRVCKPASDGPAWSNNTGLTGRCNRRR